MIQCCPWWGLQCGVPSSPSLRPSRHCLQSFILLHVWLSCTILLFNNNYLLKMCEVVESASSALLCPSPITFWGRISQSQLDKLASIPQGSSVSTPPPFSALELRVLMAMTSFTVTGPNSGLRTWTAGVLTHRVIFSADFEGLFQVFRISHTSTILCALYSLV